MAGLPSLEQLQKIVRAAAQTELTSRFMRVKQHIKSDGSILTEADLAMQKALFQALEASWPAIPFLGEEMSSERQQALLAESNSGLWVVDPIDGTSNFSLGIPFYSVSVAFLFNGEVELAVVYDPERDELFSARRGHGACLNEQPLSLQQLNSVTSMTTGMVDFKRLPANLAARLATQPPYKSQRSFGSVALDWCWLAAGRGDVYVHGKQKLWDYAAGQLIFHETGGVSSTLEGEAVFNGSLTPRSAVLAVNSTLFDEWMGYLQG